MTTATAVDALDALLAGAFDGYVVRKDLAAKFKGQYPVPTYVGEFLLGRYCASTDPEEIAEGLEIVQRLMSERTVRAGTQELFKARARERGSVKLIDLVTARLDAKTDAYLAELPSLQIKDVRISPELVQEHERLLTGGFYAEVELEYDAVIAQEKNGRPFGVAGLRPIQFSKRTALEEMAQGRVPSRRQVFRRKFAAAFFGLGIYAPVRGRNWWEMRWGDHLREEQPGQWWIEISGEDLKNGTYGETVNTYRLRLSKGAVAWVLWWREQLREFVGEDFETVTPLVFPMLSTLKDEAGQYRWMKMSHKYFLECVDNAALEVLGQRFRPHMLRHCVATHIVSGGRIDDAQQAATLLGDTLGTVLKLYFRPDEQKALDEDYYAELDADE